MATKLAVVFVLVLCCCIFCHACLYLAVLHLVFIYNGFL